MLELGPLLAQGFFTIMSELTKKAADAGFDELTGGIRSKSRKLNFEQHLERTFERCTKVKTLLNRDQSVDLLSIYVPVSFKFLSHTVDDTTLIDEIWTNKRTIVSGTGGGGKTIFTRYFWISCFVRPRGKIPVYIELRKINELSKFDLATFIFHTIVTDPDSSSREHFDAAVRDGRFIFILDGFDEVKEERRDEIERQILQLSESSRDSIFLVSGRPDERFDSWQSYSNFQVSALTKEQVVVLIQRIDFDSTVKAKFIARVKKDLYDKHKSFLSTPLLCTIMLITFDAFADIPEKMHVFYDQAFDTLFAKHDALKEAFKRQIYSKLPIDQFKHQFSYFCLITYDREEFSFKESRLLENIRDSKRVTGIDFSEESFAKDLRESVCMLKVDGLDIVFSHRSFQEYFTAYCLARMDHQKVRDLLPRYVARDSDNVVPMLFDMNRQIVEDNYIVPWYEDNKERMLSLTKARTAEQVFSSFDHSVFVPLLRQRIEKGGDIFVQPHIFMQEKFGFAHFSRVLQRLFPHKFDSALKKFMSMKRDDEMKRLASIAPSLLKFDRPATQRRGPYSDPVLFSDGKWKLESDIHQFIAKWYMESSIWQFKRERCKIAIQVCDEILSSRAGRNKSLSDILGV